MIVLYDGDCGFCRWAIAWAIRRDDERVLDVAPIQSDIGERFLSHLAPAERLESAHVVDGDGHVHSGGRAAHELLSALPSTRLLARLTGLSPRVTDGVYAFVARHRTGFSRLVPAGAKRKADLVVLERGESFDD